MKNILRIFFSEIQYLWALLLLIILIIISISVLNNFSEVSELRILEPKRLSIVGILLYQMIYFSIFAKEKRQSLFARIPIRIFEYNFSQVLQVFYIVVVNLILLLLINYFNSNIDNWSFYESIIVFSIFLFMNSIYIFAGNKILEQNQEFMIYSTIGSIITFGMLGLIIYGVFYTEKIFGFGSAKNYEITAIIILIISVLISIISISYNILTGNEK